MAQVLTFMSNQPVTRGELELIWPPEATKTYCPVAHGEVVDAVKRAADRQLGLALQQEHYGLGRNGAQLFFALTYGVPGQSAGLAIAGRNSYDKSLAVGLVSGARVFVCDNLALAGDSFKVLRKHTSQVLADLTMLAHQAVDAARPAFAGLTEIWQQLQQVPCAEDRGYEVLGRMFGHEVLRAQQLSLAMQAWRENRHGFGRSLFGLYQACTDGAKRGALDEKIEVLGAIHRFFDDELGRALAARQLPEQTRAGERLLAVGPGLEID